MSSAAAPRCWTAGEMGHALRAAFAMGSEQRTDEPLAVEIPNGLRCTSYAPRSFQAMSELFGISVQRYLWEWDLDDSHALKPGGGRQGQFLKSRGGSFLLKTILKTEFLTLMDVLQDLYQHLLQHPNSLLAPFFACLRLAQGAQSSYVLVQGNVCDPSGLPPQLFSHKLEVFDLKGRAPKRHLPRPQDGEVVRDTHLSRLFPLAKDVCRLLQDQLAADLAFLQAHQLMDYSLLVAVARPTSPKDSGSMAAGSVVVVGCPVGENPPKTGTMVRAPKASRSAFQRYYGGIAAAAPATGEVFYIGLIDSLTHYNAGKVVANLCKRFRWEEASLCTIPPKHYAARLRHYAACVFPAAPEGVPAAPLWTCTVELKLPRAEFEDPAMEFPIGVGTAC
eukprot:RCo036654